MFARASAFAEIIELLNEDKLKTGISQMSKVLESPDKNFQIGGSKDARPTGKTPTTTA